MKTIVGPVILIMILGAAESSVISFKFIQNTCDHVYGTPLAVTSEQNFIQCGRSCAEHTNGTCNSIMYNPVTRLCMLNEDIQVNTHMFPNNCGFQYGVRVIKYYGCPSDWTYTGGRCYKYVDKWYNWFECKQECESEGGMLARLYEDATYNILYEVAEAAWNAGASTDWYYPWAGIADLDELGGEGNYTDAYGEPYPTSLWSDFRYNGAYEDCGYVGPSYTYMDGCEWEWSCMCEKNPGFVISIYGSQ